MVLTNTPFLSLYEKAAPLCPPDINSIPDPYYPINIYKVSPIFQYTKMVFNLNGKPKPVPNKE